MLTFITFWLCTKRHILQCASIMQNALHGFFSTTLIHPVTTKHFTKVNCVRYTLCDVRTKLWAAIVKGQHWERQAMVTEFPIN